MIPRALHLLLTALLGFACSHSNSAFCDGHPDEPQCGGTDGPTSCSSSAECAAPTAVCDVGGTMRCVECTEAEAAACTGAAPVCGDDLACRGCTAHVECPDSLACLPDGSCADPDDVAYVAPTGGGATCTFQSPCSEISAALATARPIVKLTGTTNEQVTLNNRDVTVLADPGAKLTDTGIGILLKIDGSSQVAIYDLEIGDALGAGSFGISLQPGNTATLLLTRVKLQNNGGGGSPLRRAR